MTESTTRIRRLLADSPGECCREDLEQRLDELDSLAETAFRVDSSQEVFAVLGNETRYRLARVLVTAGEELCVCELEPLVDVSESAVSHALSDLVEAGLATRRKEGNWRYYRATALAGDLFEAADHALGDRAGVDECGTQTGAETEEGQANGSDR
jgi:DNA-binding transcriptional ArsR family regulator